MLNMCMCIYLKARFLNEGVVIASSTFTEENFDVGQFKTNVSSSRRLLMSRVPAAAPAQGFGNFLPDKTCFQHILQW